MATNHSDYLTDVGYTYGYYNEFNPLRLKLAFLNAGIKAPKIDTICELGFGQGISLNIYAAASSAKWVGTDLNPSHVSLAQELTYKSGTKAKLFNQSFKEFCKRDDLPEFDYIVIHGIWSWISDENRAVIVDFLRNKLKVGGVVYISYNTTPGWANMFPIRELFVEYTKTMSALGNGVINNVNTAINFIDNLIDTDPQYLQANPYLKDRIAKLKEQDRNYLAHEYFNNHWSPISFSEMNNWLKPCNLQFVCSANYLDAIDDINLTKEQQELLSTISDNNFRQTVRDFCINQQFRKDYWVKGIRPLTSMEQIKELQAMRVILSKNINDITFSIKSSLGDVTLQEIVYMPIVKLLSNYKVWTLGQLEETLKNQNIKFNHIIRAIMMLSTLNAIQLAQNDNLIDESKEQCKRLNNSLIDLSRSSSNFNYLASPVTGSGIEVSRFDQLFLLAISKGYVNAKDWASFAWEALKSQDYRIIKDGNPMYSSIDNLKELESIADSFKNKRLPIIKALGLVKL